MGGVLQDVPKYVGVEKCHSVRNERDFTLRFDTQPWLKVCKESMLERGKWQKTTEYTKVEREETDSRS